MFKMSTRSFKVVPKMVFADLPNTYHLSAAEKSFYKEQGYLVIPGLIDFTSLYSYKQHFQRLAAGLEDSGHITVMKEPALRAQGATGEDVINKFQDILFDDVFGGYFEHPRLLHVITQIICGEQDDGLKWGDNITAMHSMFINKPPGTGPHPPHQDLHYFPFRPASRVIASWTAIDHVNEENGTLWVSPKSHAKGELYQHGKLKGANKMYHGISDEVVGPYMVKLEMNPGDTVFFHPLLIHGSGSNLSKNYRKSISGHFANSSCSYVPLEGSTQLLADEFSKLSRQRGYTLSYTDFFKFRNKQVKGVRCNL